MDADMAGPVRFEITDTQTFQNGAGNRAVAEHRPALLALAKFSKNKKKQNREDASGFHKAVAHPTAQSSESECEHSVRARRALRGGEGLRKTNGRVR